MPRPRVPLRATPIARGRPHRAGPHAPRHCSPLDPPGSPHGAPEHPIQRAGATTRREPPHRGEVPTPHQEDPPTPTRTNFASEGDHRPGQREQEKPQQSTRAEIGPGSAPTEANPQTSQRTTPGAPIAPGRLATHQTETQAQPDSHDLRRLT